jgi:dephospho-CoA kinase
MFEKAGARVIDADQIARQVVEPGSPALNELVDQFGQQILKPDGALDRRALADRIFHDEGLRQKVNSIVHPRIRAIEREQLDRWRHEKLVVLSAALLLENHMEALVDYVVVVIVDETTRRERLTKQGAWTERQIAARLAAQMPQNEKTARADFVIDNSGTIERTERQVRAILQALKTTPPI